MRKLNQRKIRWIIREMEKKELSVCKIAKLQHITPRHARRVYKKYRGVKKPVLLPCGRKPKLITQEEADTITALRNEHPVGAVNLEMILDSWGKHIPHNRIHRILKEKGIKHIKARAKHPQSNGKVERLFAD
ncbi:MAG: hypothetical protein HY930_06775 [Euryarchaeota archaeon]|nr:hypothetical protein [Euryarchaeota archaeon]